MDSSKLLHNHATSRTAHRCALAPLAHGALAMRSALGERRHVPSWSTAQLRVVVLNVLMPPGTQRQLSATPMLALKGMSAHR